MAAARTRTRLSNQSAASTRKRHDATVGACKVPVKSGSPSTPLRPRSPVKRHRKVLSLLQKQALIDNLQLEITERARRLRAQYHLQAQGLRSRIEIRVNRIPTSLRKVKMGELMRKCLEQQQRLADARAPPPPLPAKDPARLSPQKLAPGPSRAQAQERGYRVAQKVSAEVKSDKENEMDALRGEQRSWGFQMAGGGSTRPIQVLSPTSSNSRLAARADRPTSPTKLHMSRPGSPLKTHGASRSAVTSVLSSMVERARATRHGVARKVTAASEASSTGTSNATNTTAAARGRRPATAASNAAPKPAAPVRPATRAGHRASGTSEASEESSSTVVRKPSTLGATKKTTMGAIRKGVVGGVTRKKTTATTVAATAMKVGAATASNASKPGGRVLRKRA